MRMHCACVRSTSQSINPIEATFNRFKKITLLIRINKLLIRMKMFPETIWLIDIQVITISLKYQDSSNCFALNFSKFLIVR